MSLFAIFAIAACTEDVNPDGGWSSTVPDGEFLYIGNKDGQVTRVFANTGLLDTSWVYPGSGSVGEIYGSPVIAGGVVYGTGYSCTGNNCRGEVYAAAIQTSLSAWATGSYRIETKLVGTVALGESTLVVGTAEIDDADDPKGFLLALDPRADAGLPAEEQVGSREKWRLPVDGAVWGTPVVVDNVAYFGTMGGTVYAVDLEDLPQYESDVDSRVKWTFNPGAAIAGSLLHDSGKLYFGAFNRKVYALDIQTRAQNSGGEQIEPASEWSFDTGGWMWAQPLLHEGRLYVANLSGDVYALDPQTGQPVWPRPAEAGAEVVGQPVIINNSRGPALAVPSGKEDVSILLLADGQSAGQFNTGGNSVFSTPLRLGDRLFVHTANGQLRVFNTSSLREEVCIQPMGEGNRC